jgi:hypothetical protein
MLGERNYTSLGWTTKYFQLQVVVEQLEITSHELLPPVSSQAGKFPERRKPWLHSVTSLQLVDKRLFNGKRIASGIESDTGEVEAWLS